MDEPALPPMRSANADVEDFPATDKGRGSYWTDARLKAKYPSLRGEHSFDSAPPRFWRPGSR
jgi:hypothetical protein